MSLYARNIKTKRFLLSCISKDSGYQKIVFMHDDIFFYPKFILHFSYLGSNPITSPSQICNFCNAIDELKKGES